MAVSLTVSGGCVNASYWRWCRFPVDLSSNARGGNAAASEGVFVGTSSDPTCFTPTIAALRSLVLND
ncbi:hypothetical protein [Haladaptatus sp. R4]|uniref:hypothetical protein n=1 Tax=Haladaptatus sp. R4 TaxID=1679489 RepID=UPI000A3F2AE3|nr:hypothetical protein [Haladaptatus sp. R4]